MDFPSFKTDTFNIIKISSAALPIMESGAFLRCLFGTSVVIAFFIQKTPSVETLQTAIYGGQGGIRTLDTLLTYTRVPVVRLRPAQPPVHISEQKQVIDPTSA